MKNFFLRKKKTWKHINQTSNRIKITNLPAK